MQLDAKKMAEVVQHIRLAVKANTESWDHQRNAEEAAGDELDLADLVDELSVAIGLPDEAMELPEIYILPAVLEQLTKQSK